MSAPTHQRLGWATSDGTPPDERKAFVAVYRLLLRSVATRGRVAAVLALDAVSLFTALIVSFSTAGTPLRDAVGYAGANVSTLLPVIVLLFGAATLGDPMEDGSLVYLWLRPIRSRVHVAAAWAATVTITLPLVGVPIVAGAAMIDSDPKVLSGTTIAMVVAVVAYAALFVTGGLRFQRAFVWGLAYILIWEGFVARAGETASKLAIGSYVRSILSEATGVKMSLADFTFASGVVVPLVVAIVVLYYATRRMDRTDIA